MKLLPLAAILLTSACSSAAPPPNALVSRWSNNGTRLYKPSELPSGFSGTFSLRSLQGTLLWVSNVQNKEVFALLPDGSIRWNGRKVKTDREFRAAMLAMAKTLEYGCRK